MSQEKLWKLLVGLLVMQRPRWFRGNDTMELCLIFGALELCFMLWFVGSCPMKILKHLTFTRKFWALTTLCLNSYPETVKRWFREFSRLTLKRDLKLKTLESILGTNRSKRGKLLVYSLAKKKCPWIRVYTIQWLKTTVSKENTLRNVLKQIDITILQQLSIFSIKELLEEKYLNNKSKLKNSNINALLLTKRWSMILWWLNKRLKWIKLSQWVSTPKKKRSLKQV